MPWQNNLYHHTKLRKCARCAARYTETSNTGSWGCLYHPAARGIHSNVFHPLGTFRCCGGAEGSPGCTRIDHDDRMFRFEESLLYIQEPDIGQVSLSTAARDRVRDEEKRAGFETDRKTFVRLWRLNTVVREQYLKYGEIRELSLSVKCNKESNGNCVVLSAMDRDVQKDKSASLALSDYHTKLSNANRDGNIASRCRELYGASWRRVKLPRLQRRLLQARRAYKETVVQYRKSRCDRHGRSMHEAKGALKEVLNELSEQKKNKLDKIIRDTRAQQRAEVEIARLFSLQEQTAAQDAVENIRRVRERTLCSAAIKSIWNSHMSMENKILHIGLLEGDARAHSKWSYAPLGWKNVSFDELHSLLVANKAAMSLSSTALLLTLAPRGTKVTFLHACESVPPTSCTIDFRNSDENCDAVLAYAFRDLPWNPIVMWDSLRKMHQKDSKQPLVVRYRLSQENES